MMVKQIKISNARQNNLKSIDLEIPRNKLVVFTGVSGSGKSSLVFNVINAEAQRQLFNTFSTFVQGKLPSYPRPECDSIENLSPAIVVGQKRSSHSSKSTVGTTTDLYSYIRLLFSRVGTPTIGSSSHFSFNSKEGMCNSCNGSGQLLDIDLKMILDKSKSINDGAILFPEFKVNSIPWKYIVNTGFFELDNPVENFSKEQLDKLLYEDEVRIETGGFGFSYEGIIKRIKRLYVNINHENVSKRKKEIVNKFLSPVKCTSCDGKRLNQKALSVKVNGLNIDDVSQLQIDQLKEYIAGIKDDKASELVSQILKKTQYLIDIGLDYLSLSRGMSTLSGGESQRIRLAKQLGSSLTEMIYILDEPSTGLHPHDVYKLNDLLKSLCANGNSVLVVEHDPDVIEIADHIIDMGPYAGVNGGTIVFQGSYSDILKSSSLTGEHLNKRLGLKEVTRLPTSFFEIRNASKHNLKNVSVNIPKGLLTCVTGVAGSGKSSLIHGEFSKKFTNAIVIDQAAVGQSQRSNAATYTGLFDEIRKVFSVANNIGASIFSFNSDGACENCNGAGIVELDMAFLDPVKTVCKKCKGKRYKDSTLVYKYKGLSISDVLDFTIDQAAKFFVQEKIINVLNILQKVGLGYLTLGQPLSSLSGGECQRVKLSKELKKNGNVYILDEPTTGLHMTDVRRIINILNELVDNGNTVVVIEHNLDLVSQADWIIDMGPQGGVNGGSLLFEGKPCELIDCSNSFTGMSLQRYLKDFQ